MYKVGVFSPTFCMPYFFLIICVFLWGASPVFSMEVQEVSASKCAVKGLFVEDHTLPVVSIGFAFKRAGNAYDPEGKEGLALLAASLLDKGAGELSAYEFSKELENISSFVGFDIDKDYLYANVKTLSKYKTRAMELFISALTQPRFDASEVEVAKQKIKTTMKQLSTNPGYIAHRTWQETVYAGHPYSKSAYGVNNSLFFIEKTDLERYISTGITQDVYVSMVGDLSTEEASKFLESLCGLPRTAKVVDIPPTHLKTEGKTIVKKTHLPQSKVVFGLEGIDRSDSRFYDVYLLNHIIGGGGMSSRLMEEVREKQGLAYSIGSYLNSYENANAWMGGFSTKNQDVKNAIVAVKEELRRVAKEGVSQEELGDAKRYIKGSFYLGLDEADAIRSYLFNIQKYNLGSDYLQKRNAYIDAVSLQEINKVAGQLLRIQKMLVIVVGDVPHETL